MAYTRKASASQINMYLRCPRLWYIQYKLREKQPPTIAMVKGSLVHAVIEEFYNLNPRGCGINLYNYNEEFQKYATKLFNEILTRPRTYFGSPVPSFEEELRTLCPNDLTYAKEVTSAEKIIRNYVIYFCMQFEQFTEKFKIFAQCWYMLRPKFRELELDLDNFIGYVDAISESNGEVVIKDYKTSSLFGDGFSEEHRLQLKLYAYAYYKLHGVLPKKGVIIYLRYGVRCQYEIQDSTVQEMEDLLHLFMESTESDLAEDYPLNLEDKFCTCLKSRNPEGFASGFRCPCDQFCNKDIAEGRAVFL